MEWLGVDRRRLGTGMLVFGLAGVVMAGIVAVALVLGAFAVRDLDERLAEDQARIGASLTRLTVTMDSLAITTRNAATTLQSSSETLGEAQVVLESTADTLVSLASALDVTILGNRPFAGASERLAGLALTVNGFGSRTQTLALNLHQNGADVDQVTTQIRTLKDEVNTLASRIASFDRIDDMVGLLIGGIVLASLLTAWVAVGAAFCAWAGWRLRRSRVTDRVVLAGG